MCNKCLAGLNIPTKGRNDLSNTEVYEEDLEDDFSIDDFMYEPLGNEDELS